METDGFVRGSYNCNQNMCSLHSNTYAWHFVSINMPSSLTIGCSGQSRKLKSAQKHCLKLQSFHHLDVTHIAHLVKRDKTTSENLPINCIDLCFKRMSNMRGIPSLRISKLSNTRLKAQPRNINFR